MTNRDFYNAIINADLTAVLEDEMAKEVKEHAEAAIAKLDAGNEKRRNTVSKKALENQPLVDQIVNEILSFEYMTASAIAEVLGCSAQKASHLAKMAVEQGKAEVDDIKVPKKGTQKGYRLISED